MQKNVHGRQIKHFNLIALNLLRSPMRSFDITVKPTPESQTSLLLSHHSAPTPCPVQGRLVTAQSYTRVIGDEEMVSRPYPAPTGPLPSPCGWWGVLSFL